VIWLLARFFPLLSVLLRALQSSFWLMIERIFGFISVVFTALKLWTFTKDSKKKD
jgi:hypothetical protein